jgi:hypothetical protein
LICRSEIFELRTHTQSLGDERGTTCWINNSQSN